MADTICHATEGGLMLLAPFIARTRRKVWIWILFLAGAFFGALPDLFGAYGNIIERDHWKLYLAAHTGPIAQVLRYVPMYWLHLYVDSFTHAPGKRWWVWNELLWVEVALWAVNVAVIAWYVRLWRKNTPIPDTGRSVR